MRLDPNFGLPKGIGAPKSLATSRLEPSMGPLPSPLSWTRWPETVTTTATAPRSPPSSPPAQYSYTLPQANSQHCAHFSAPSIQVPNESMAAVAPPRSHLEPVKLPSFSPILSRLDDPTNPSGLHNSAPPNLQWPPASPVHKPPVANARPSHPRVELVIMGRPHPSQDLDSPEEQASSFDAVEDLPLLNHVPASVSSEPAKLAKEGVFNLPTEPSMEDGTCYIASDSVKSLATSVFEEETTGSLESYSATILDSIEASEAPDARLLSTAGWQVTGASTTVVKQCGSAHVVQLDVDDTLFPTSLFCDQNWLDLQVGVLPPAFRRKLDALDESVRDLFEVLHRMVVVEEVPDNSHPGASFKIAENYLLSVVIITNATIGHIKTVFPNYLPKLNAFLAEKQILIDDLVCSARDIWADEFPFDPFYIFWKAWTLQDILNQLAVDGIHSVTVVSLGDDEPERSATAFVAVEMQAFVKGTKIVRMLSSPGVEMLIAQLIYVRFFFRDMVTRQRSFDTYLQVIPVPMLLMVLLRASMRSPGDVSPKVSFSAPLHEQLGTNIIPITPDVCPLEDVPVEAAKAFPFLNKLPEDVRMEVLNMTDPNDPHTNCKVVNALLVTVPVEGGDQCFIVREVLQPHPPEIPSAYDAGVLTFDMQLGGLYELFHNGPGILDFIAEYCRELVTQEPATASLLAKDVQEFLAKSEEQKGTLSEEELRALQSNRDDIRKILNGPHTAPSDRLRALSSLSSQQMSPVNARALLAHVHGVIRFLAQWEKHLNVSDVKQQELLRVARVIVSPLSAALSP